MLVYALVIFKLGTEPVITDQATRWRTPELCAAQARYQNLARRGLLWSCLPVEVKDPKK
jgi:hypothetical protein